ncbi:hypothetical protein D3C76_348560 [compost metagenome]
MVQFSFQGFGWADQGALRYIEQHTPGLAIGDGSERGQDFQARLMVQAVQVLAITQQPHQFGTLGAVDLFQALGQLAGIGAVTSQNTRRAENADVGLAFVEAAAGGLAHGLQAVEVDIDRERRDDLAVG